MEGAQNFSLIYRFLKNPGSYTRAIALSFLSWKFCHMIYNVVSIAFLMHKQVKVDDKSESRFDDNVEPTTNNVEPKTP